MIEKIILAMQLNHVPYHTLKKLFYKRIIPNNIEKNEKLIMKRIRALKRKKVK